MTKTSTLLAGACAALLSVAAPSLAQQAPARFSPDQTRAIEGIVRDYLLRNPEILQEVMTELEKRQADAQKTAQQAVFRDKREALLNSPRDYVIGNPQGDVTLVEFFDYNCGYCKRAMSDIRAMIKADPKLRVVLKDFPVLGPGSVEAARIGLAAKAQLKGERLFDFHAKLMETRGQVNGERALSVAKEMGLDLAKLQQDAQGAEVRAALTENMELADALGLTGTPAWVIGDEVVFGAVGQEPLRKAVVNTRQCGKATC